MAFLLDTSALSLLAPGKPAVSRTFLTWIEENEERLRLSVITVADVAQGIARLRDAGGTAEADALSAWLGRALELFGSRVIDLTPALAIAVGELSARATGAGRNPGFPDVAIAATALAGGMAVVTSNGRHFAPLGVAVLDPSAL